MLALGRVAPQLGIAFLGAVTGTIRPARFEAGPCSDEARIDPGLFLSFAGELFFERTTDADKARFLDIAKGSCGEVRSMYYVAEDINYVSAAVAHQRRQRAIKISRGIATLTSRFRQ